LETSEALIGGTSSVCAPAQVLEPPELIARLREAAAGALQWYEESAPD